MQAAVVTSICSALEKGLVTLFVLPKLLLHDGSEVIRVI